ncbi:2-dehydropantoate 2-reductase [Candidatus Filomicrobium marinum]|uniref:2-dehydropantoate 2-reductase n=1 Tax=Candidatus Filomicrobium marinum TaxID=1608628 RepID=A0A0D6JE93_9HYPH|nr:2-dehydropantoate 2-reductase [Candidatus Filomicrobium marinum]CFX15001.1 2-dehydropantoate 2-reductase [Candidatus Filomicrobium marinum]CPR17890.1 2-dehydropantoate 2-reductase [Candidatus Filomicrobium marinum]
MRILIVGAGAVGGYFGGKLLEAGRDVTFLVRPGRAAALKETGLNIKSPLGDAALGVPPMVQSQELNEPFDLIILSCKAYDLESAISGFSAGVGPQSAILPLLNGMRHISVLQERFGQGAVLGGQCVISTTLDEVGTIHHLNTKNHLTFGEVDGNTTKRVEEITATLSDAGFAVRASSKIMLEMWEKWVILASLAGSTCLMRASVGEINAAPGGAEFALSLVEECRSVAKAAGYEPRPAALEATRALVTEKGSPMTASMFRDIEHGSRIEADQIIGDLLARADAAGLDSPVLRVIYCHLKAYEARHGY